MLSATRGCWLQRVLALEEMGEETLLQSFAVFAVKMREVGVAVHFQPFLLGAGGEPALEIAARVQADAAPIGGGQQGRLDVFVHGGARGVVVVAAAVRRLASPGVSAQSLASSSFGNVSGPATGSPVTLLLAPRSPTPCCTLATWRGCQLLKKSHRMPPWRHSSR